ncbi:immunoglobulin-like and fibronectin type III domain-containing protein 1 [Hoplias malabaricus]|uniref:immunoglobulin-like and fibronectin type III domain-containing protein 1 n=1 Tax=Hoplias malabaricus TaxID=27720 RepID=UPI00346367A5
MLKNPSKVMDKTAEGQVGIRKKSKVPGVMIIQSVEELPEGKSHPDFSRKPIALTIQEGKLAVFKAKVIGEPKPSVTWARNNGDISDPQKYQTKFDPVSQEHTIEMPNVSPDQADTYKCFAINDFGRASVTVVLNVIEVGFNKDKEQKAAQMEPGDLRMALKRKSKVRPKTEQKKDGEIDPKFWEILLCADKKDYEHICAEYGVTDFRWMLKKLNELKKEREEEQVQFVKNISNLKHIAVKGDGTASFELDMDLLDINSNIFIYKDGEMIQYSKEMEQEVKHSLKQVGKKFVFTIRDLLSDDAGLYQLDVEDVNVFSTDFKIPQVDFLVKIQEVKAKERQDAVFECVLSNPFSKIMWVGKSSLLEHGEKYDITVSEDKLIHRLVVKDCMQVDKGIYAAVAGIKSCNAWLIVEADKDPNLYGKKKARKTTQAGGSGLDLAKIAAEQQAKLQTERKERIDVGKTAKDEKVAAGTEASPSLMSGYNGSGADLEFMSNSVYASDSGSGFSSVSGSSVGDNCGLEDHTEDGWIGVDTKGTGGQVLLTSGLSDIYVARGKPAELVCKLNNSNTNGVWSKDGEKLSSKGGVTISQNQGIHKLTFQRCNDSDAGQYEFDASGCKTRVMLTVGDVPEFDPDELYKFSKPVTVKVGQTASFKLMFPPQDSLEIKWFKDVHELTDCGGVKVVKEINHSRLQIKDCLESDAGEIKIQLKNLFGTVEALSRLIVLGKPSIPKGPVEVIESTDSVIEIKWNPPNDDGGSAVTNYIIERQQAGQGSWTKLGDVSADRVSFKDRNVSHGKRYMYRIYAENTEGIGDPLETENITAGTLIFPGPLAPPKVVSAFKNCINIEWTPPEMDGGTKILGYQIEKRKKDTKQWVALNPVNEPIKALKYSVKEVSEGSEYEFRVSAINASGVGEPSGSSLMACAKNPNLKPYFKDPEDFIVVRAGNSARIKINYEASPIPDIQWMKNNEPVPSCFNTVNTEKSSTLTIPNSKRTDSGVYTIVAKNSSGKASFDIEVRVTDEPKRPGPVALEQLVHGKVIITWAPSPDQELDDRLHYIVAKYDSDTRMWRTIADRLFCTTYTTSVLSGREYHFRVYAKNDMGLSEPSESPTWGINSCKASVFTSLPTMITFERPPSILVPLKVHTPPKGYQCYMTCAIRGCPAPYVSWYLNGICINSNKHYYITNVHGVCSMHILRVEPSDGGEYKVVAVNSYGKAECSTRLKIKDDPNVHGKARMAQKILIARADRWLKRRAGQNRKARTGHEEKTTTAKDAERDSAELGREKEVDGKIPDGHIFRSRKEDMSGKKRTSGHPNITRLTHKTPNTQLAFP